MKRLNFFGFVVFLCVITILCTASGCIGENREPSSSEPEQSSYEYVSDISSEVSEEENIPEEDYFTLHGHPVIPDPEKLPDYCREEISDHLYLTDIALPTGFYGEGGLMEIEISGDVFKASYWNDMQTEAVYSLITGKHIQTVSLPYSARNGVLLPNGGIIFADFDYDADIAYVYRRDPGDEDDNFLLSVENTDTAEITKDGRFFGCIDSENSLIIYDTATCEILHTVKNIAKGYIQISAGESEFFVLGNSWEVKRIDPVTGEVTVVEGLDSLPAALRGEIYSAYYSGIQNGFLFVGIEPDGKRIFIPYTNGFETLLDVGFGYVVSQSFGDNGSIIRIYDMRSALKVTEIELPEGCYNVDAAFHDNGLIYITGTSEDGTRVYVFDLPSLISEGCEGEDIGIISDSEAELEEKIAEIKKEIEDETGIEIIFGSEGNDFTISDYVGVAALDKYEIYTTLKQTKEILAKFPKNMLREAYSDTHRGMKFYLCGSLHGVSSEGLSLAGAVTTQYNGYIVIAFDIHENMEYNIPHELSHAFDNRIIEMQDKTDVNWLVQWENFTPVKNAYAFSYTNYYSLNAYTAGYEHDEDRIWFIDSYSRTFPTEDRARILERLFNCDGELDEDLNSPHLIEKARLYCKILRECFPSCKAETPFWEEFLPDEDEALSEAA